MPVKTHKYSNKEITIAWKPEICIHSKICWQGLRQVFDPARKPWIIAGAADSAKIMEQIDKCPSGALSYNRMEAPGPAAGESSPPAAQAVNIIECLPNGPLLFKGKIIVKKTDGTEEIKTGTVALCRCGASKNKPYCDGGHSATGFEG